MTVTVDPPVETFEIEIPIFGMYIELYIGNDFNKIPDWVSEELGAAMPKLDDGEVCSDGLTIDLSQLGLDGYIVVALKDFYKKVAEDFNAAAGVMTHEALHATKIIMTSRGIPFDEDNDELIAYIQEYVVEEILTAIEKDKPKTDAEEKRK